MIPAAAVLNQVSYEWSWSNTKGQLPEQPSAFDAANQVPNQLTSQVRL